MLQTTTLSSTVREALILTRLPSSTVYTQVIELAKTKPQRVLTLTNSAEFPTLSDSRVGMDSRVMTKAPPTHINRQEDLWSGVFEESPIILFCYFTTIHIYGRVQILRRLC